METSFTTPPPHNQAWVALVSTDPQFRKGFHEVLDDPALPVRLSLAIDCPFNAMTQVELNELRRSAPDLLVVDIESDPKRGLEFIRSVIDSGHATAVMAASRDLSQELLLQALQSGVMEVVAKPLDPPQLLAALNRTLLRADRYEVAEEKEKQEGRILAFFGAKGGVGTTAVAANVAVEIRRLTGERTLLLDLDVEQGEAALLLGMDPSLSLLDLLRNFQPEVSSLLAACIDHDPNTGLDLLAAPVQGSAVQPEDFDLLTGESMRQVLAFLKEHYSYIVIDRPKSFHPAFTCVLEEADNVFIITTPDLQGLRNITRSVPLLKRVSESKGAGHVHMIVNRYPAHPAITLAEIQETVAMPIYHSIAADFFPLNESIQEHVPIVMKNTSQFARDVRALAAKVTGTAGAEPRKGILNRMIGAVRGR